MVVEEIRMPSGAIVRIHDDYAECTELVTKRLENLSRIMTNSYKRRVGKETAHNSKFRDN